MMMTPGISPDPTDLARGSAPALQAAPTAEAEQAMWDRIAESGFGGRKVSEYRYRIPGPMDIPSFQWCAALLANPLRPPEAADYISAIASSGDTVVEQIAASRAVLKIVPGRAIRISRWQVLKLLIDHNHVPRRSAGKAHRRDDDTRVTRVHAGLMALITSAPHAAVHQLLAGLRRDALLTLSDIRDLLDGFIAVFRAAMVRLCRVASHGFTAHLIEARLVAYGQSSRWRLPDAYEFDEFSPLVVLAAAVTRRGPPAQLQMSVGMINSRHREGFAPAF